VSECKLQAATDRIEALEAYSRRDNLIISGLPAGNYVVAVITENTDREESAGLPNTSVERSALKLFNEQLGVSIQPTDISVAHRLKRQGDSAPTTLVKFKTKKLGKLFMLPDVSSVSFTKCECTLMRI